MKYFILLLLLSAPVMALEGYPDQCLIYPTIAPFTQGELPTVSPEGQLYVLRATVHALGDLWDASEGLGTTWRSQRDLTDAGERFSGGSATFALTAADYLTDYFPFGNLWLVTLQDTLPLFPPLHPERMVAQRMGVLVHTALGFYIVSHDAVVPLVASRFIPVGITPINRNNWIRWWD